MGILMKPIFTFSVLPVIPFLIIFLISYLWRRDSRRAVLLAMDVTTLFLILSVSGLFNQIFGTGFGIYLIVLFMLVAGGLIGSAQNRIKGAVNPKRLVKAVWRLSFLTMSAFYVIFFIIGLFPYIWAV
jgi:hypothetical protein